ncbi:MAG: sigma-70 family RNA polymerase sigma factor [Bacteroidales bacterium]|nr:sigma-70 family RNA polymerase sigma factor [Bacteroidales bacterium]
MSPNKQLTDHETERLIEACRKQSREAQCALYTKYCKAMYNVALRISGNRQEAEDVMQEAFITAFEKLHTYDGKASFGSWLKKIVLHKAIDQSRKHKKMIFDDVDELNVQLADEDNDLPPYFNLTIDAVYSILQTLKPQYRIILNLRLIEECSYEDIAKLLDLQYGAVRTRYARARRILAGKIYQEAQSTMLN